ncbi:MAG: hypothetical protein ABTQ32_13065 [Myxococcaceae bacterium]
MRATRRRWFFVALAIGAACGAMRPPPLMGPQPRSAPCGECQAGLTCEFFTNGLSTCARRCDAGCLSDETCTSGLCRETCTASADCDVGNVLLFCSRDVQPGVCLPFTCSGASAEICGKGYACSSDDRGELGFQPRPINLGVCLKLQ